MPLFIFSGNGRLYLAELVLKGKFLYVVANFVWMKEDPPSHAMFAISDLDGNYSRVRRP